MKILNWLACLLTIVGALNWGLIGFFHLNLVESILHSIPMADRVVYSVVGIAGLWMIIKCLRGGCRS